MIECTERQWKQFIEGMFRGRFGPYEQKNFTLDADSFRTYFDGDEPVARMCVLESNTDRLGQNCHRTFEIDEDLLSLCSDIYIATPEDWSEWDEFDGDDEAWLTDRNIIQ